MESNRGSQNQNTFRPIRASRATITAMNEFNAQDLGSSDEEEEDHFAEVAQPKPEPIKAAPIVAAKT